MKTLEQIVDGLWKPESYFYDKLALAVYSEVVYKDREEWNTGAHYIIERKQQYAEKLMKPFYGYDVQEPIVKICKRILEKPNRFHLVKALETNKVVKSPRRAYVEHIVSWGVIQDKDTGQKFIREKQTSCVTNPSFLTYDEKVLLTSVIDEWYNYMKESLVQKEIKLENKRKDKFRQEMVELYKDL